MTTVHSRKQSGQNLQINIRILNCERATIFQLTLTLTLNEFSSAASWYATNSSLYTIIAVEDSLAKLSTSAVDTL